MLGIYPAWALRASQQGFYEVQAKGVLRPCRSCAVCCHSHPPCCTSHDWGSPRPDPCDMLPGRSHDGSDTHQSWCLNGCNPPVLFARQTAPRRFVSRVQSLTDCRAAAREAHCRLTCTAWWIQPRLQPLLAFPAWLPSTPASPTGAALETGAYLGPSARLHHHQHAALLMSRCTHDAALVCICCMSPLVSESALQLNTLAWTDGRKGQGLLLCATLLAAVLESGWSLG